MTTHEKNAVILLDVLARCQTLIQVASNETFDIVLKELTNGNYSTDEVEKMLAKDFLNHVRDHYEKEG